MPGDNSSRSSVQSLSRGLAIIEALAAQGEMTATELAIHLGLHQSSVSRLLRSLLEAGIVRKPHFHMFSLDLGILRLAGIALHRFPLVAISAEACLNIHRETRWGAAVGLLNVDRLLYMAFVAPGNHTAAPILVDDSSFPLHNSSIGLALLHHAGKRTLLAAVAASHQRLSGTPKPFSPEALARITADSISRHGFLYLHAFLHNRFNAAQVFDTPHGPAALAVFSYTHDATPEQTSTVLNETIRHIQKRLKPTTPSKTGAAVAGKGKDK